MKNIHLVLIIAILILIYLISMQWLWADKKIPSQVASETPQVVTTELPTVPTTSPETVFTPVETSQDTAPQNTPTVEATNISSPTPTTPPETDTTKPENSQLIEYKNTNFGYHLSMPKQMYYAGFGPSDGARHTLGIQLDALPESLWTATVRVYYYGKKVLPELQNTTRYVDPNGAYILLLLDNAYSVRIESNNLNSPTVKAIESTIGIDQ